MQVGVSAEWIRKAERVGQLPPPERDAQGDRIYNPTASQYIRDIWAQKKRLIVPPAVPV